MPRLETPRRSLAHQGPRSAPADRVHSSRRAIAPPRAGPVAIQTRPRPAPKHPPQITRSDRRHPSLRPSRRLGRAPGRGAGRHFSSRTRKPRQSAGALPSAACRHTVTHSRPRVHRGPAAGLLPLPHSQTRGRRPARHRPAVCEGAWASAWLPTSSRRPTGAGPPGARPRPLSESFSARGLALFPSLSQRAASRGVRGPIHAFAMPAPVLGSPILPSMRPALFPSPS